MLATPNPIKVQQLVKNAVYQQSSVPVEIQQYTIPHNGSNINYISKVVLN